MVWRLGKENEKESDKKMAINADDDTKERIKILDVRKKEGKKRRQRYTGMGKIKIDSRKSKDLKDSTGADKRGDKNKENEKIKEIKKEKKVREHKHVWIKKKKERRNTKKNIGEM